MISELELSKILVRVVTGILNDSSYPILIDEQNTRRPVNPYGTVHVIGLYDDGLENNYTIRNNDGTYTNVTETPIRAHVSFKFFFTNSFQRADTVKRGLWAPSATDALAAQGIGVLKRRGIVNDTVRIDGGFEERARFDATFSMTSQYRENVNNIISATATGRVEYPERTVVTTIN